MTTPTVTPPSGGIHNKYAHGRPGGPGGTWTRCGWQLQWRYTNDGRYHDGGRYVEREDCDLAAYEVLKATRAKGYPDAEVLITPIWRNPMTKQWTNGDDTLRLRWRAQGGDLYLHTAAPDHTLRKHYEWWERDEALADAETLAARLALEPAAEAQNA